VKQVRCMHEAGRRIHYNFSEMKRKKNTSALPQGLPQQVV
jgi:hypothetical protein